MVKEILSSTLKYKKERSSSTTPSTNIYSEIPAEFMPVLGIFYI